jgi:hypothetical protein
MTSLMNCLVMKREGNRVLTFRLAAVVGGLGSNLAGTKTTNPSLAYLKALDPGVSNCWVPLERLEIVQQDKLELVRGW